MKVLPQNGEIAITVNGKPYQFKFGMLAARMIELHSVQAETSIDNVSISLWAGLMSRKDENGLSDSFSHLDTLALIDEMQDEDLATVIAVQRQAFERLPNVASRVNKLLGLNADGSRPTTKS